MIINYNNILETPQIPSTNDTYVELISQEEFPNLIHVPFIPKADNLLYPPPPSILKLIVRVRPKFRLHVQVQWNLPLYQGPLRWVIPDTD